MPLPQHQKLINRLLKGAEAHGRDSEPDHEVGDLQDILRTCFGYMTGQQIMDVYRANVEIAEYADTEEEVA